jgi:ATP-dependent RNA helicase DeaD
MSLKDDFISGETLPDTTLTDLSATIQAAAARAGWRALTPVQAKGIPYVQARRDVMIQARTGSGKTGAFLLPMLDRLTRRGGVRCLVLVPTRELALQVCTEAGRLFAGTDLCAVAVYGGVGYGPQIAALEAGAQVVVGTPGRVLDLLLRRVLILDDLEMLVFDEADRMLSMGFYPDMKALQRYLPADGVQACMFSATFPDNVLHTAREFMHQPEFISLSRDHVHVTEVEHAYYLVVGADKGRTLVRIIELENPESGIIFCNTKDRVHYVTAVLQRFGYDADELSADLSQVDRERVLGKLRAGQLRFLVATDIAARGLDIPQLSHVIQFEPPDDVENYIHRAGRTGRAGAAGTALSLVSGPERLDLERISKRYGIAMIERAVPTDADVAAVVAERITAQLEARLRGRDKLEAERSRRFAPLVRQLATLEDEEGILTMLIDDYYQRLLHAPAAQPQPTATHAAPPTRQRPARRRRRR